MCKQVPDGCPVRILVAVAEDYSVRRAFYFTFMQGFEESLLTFFIDREGVGEYVEWDVAAFLLQEMFDGAKGAGKVVGGDLADSITSQTQS